MVDPAYISEMWEYAGHITELYDEFIAHDLFAIYDGDYRGAG